MGLHNRRPVNSQFPSSSSQHHHHPSFLTQPNKDHPPPLKTQTSLLDGLIQQHHESLEDIFSRSSDVLKVGHVILKCHICVFVPLSSLKALKTKSSRLSQKTTSPAHPPGFQSTQTSSRFFPVSASASASNLGVNSNLGGVTGVTGVTGVQQKNHPQTESILRSLFDNNTSSASAASNVSASSSSIGAGFGDGRNPLESLHGALRTTPPMTGIPPPPPGLGLPQHQHHLQLQQQQH